MYLPPHYKETRLDVLHQLMRDYPFATLVTLGDNGLEANHVPLLLDPEPAPYGTLKGHLSRANPTWRKASSDVNALAIFQGPQAYITPSWYPSKRETGKVVPTWNYAVVHASGPLRVIHDQKWLCAFINQLTDHFESARPEPWKVNDAPVDYMNRQFRAIVGLEIRLNKLQGKWKLSQNKSPSDRHAVVSGLQATGDATALVLADLMRQADKS
jgi:transcriptional regulator